MLENLVGADTKEARRLQQAIGKISGNKPEEIISAISNCIAVRRISNEADLASFWKFAVPQMLEALAQLENGSSALEFTLGQLSRIKDPDTTHAFAQNAVRGIVDYLAAKQKLDITSYNDVLIKYAEAGLKKHGWCGPYYHFRIVYARDIDEVLYPKKK